MSFETVTVVGTLLAVLVAVVISNWAMLRGFRTELKTEITGLRVEMKDGNAELRSDMVALRTELKTEITGLRVEMKDGNAELRSDMVGLRTELKSDVVDLRTELKSDLVDLRTELKDMNQRIDSTNSRIDRLADALMVPAVRAG